VVWAHHALENKSEMASHLKEKYSYFTQEELERFTFGEGTVDTILKLPGAERRRIFIFQSNAMLVNAMQIIKDYERVLVQHVVKPFASDSRIRPFLGRLITRTHRVTEYKICSQTDILRYLFQHMRDSREDSLSSLCVKDCGPFGNLTTITVEERAIDGFLKMLDSRADACAILDMDGRIVASLSATDLRGMTNDRLKTILLPILEFFPAMTGSRPSPPLVCSLDNRLVDVMRGILKATTRRCWVVDQSMRPLGFLPMGKIIYAVLNNPCEHL
jgi:hypothetical protein